MEESAFSRKEAAVHTFLSSLSPRILLDLGANTGRYSVMAAELGYSVLAVDRDAACIDRLYRDCKTHNLPIDVALADFHRLETFGNFLSRPFRSSSTRFQAEVVMCLALIHHLVSLRGIDFKIFFEKMSSLTSEYLIFEFVFPGDPFFATHPAPAGYNEEEMLSVLRTMFEIVRSIDSTDTRRVYLCTKSMIPAR
jgi:hypothetical protein